MSLLARLIEAGTPGDLIEEVAMMIAEKRLAEKALEDGRAKARERQARKRERDESRDVTESYVTDCDTHDQGLSRPPNEKISNPPTHTPEKKTPARKGHRLPSDWEPEPLSNGVSADVATWPPGAIERELARFRDWAASATGPNATKTDWNAAWRNWLRKAHDEGRHLKNDRQRSQFSKPTTRQIGERVAARLSGGSSGPADGLPRLGSSGGYG